jgi:LasA protease
VYLSKKFRFSILIFLAVILPVSSLLVACESQVASASLVESNNDPQVTATPSVENAPISVIATPLPSRPSYQPGELVDYIAQTGDTLPALAVRFNTRVSEILEANSFIPADATTMPPGMPMKIPIYYLPFWGSQYQILPDSLFVNGPSQLDFDTKAFVDQHPGWLARYSGYVSGANRSGAQIVDLVALNFSISPRLLLALLEHQSGALSEPFLSDERTQYPLGVVNRTHRGLYMQLVWAANKMNNGYYGWRTGRLSSFDLLNGRLERPDPWQNAATVAIQYFFSHIYSDDLYLISITQDGFAQTYTSLYGDPWGADDPHVPGSLTQPAFLLPFEPGKTWAYTGGPHTGWGQGDPWAALDFAPPALIGGCTETKEWATAVAGGIISRSELATVVLDLDGDGDERTGWSVIYFHIATQNRAGTGKVVNAGDPLGHPSCEGGVATGSHIHIVRKYNGEWIPAAGPLAFDLEGWIAHNGPAPYLGTLTRYSRTVQACQCSNHSSWITSDANR